MQERYSIVRYTTFCKYMCTYTSKISLIPLTITILCTCAEFITQGAPRSQQATGQIGIIAVSMVDLM